MSKYNPSTLSGDLAPINAELEKIRDALNDQLDRRVDSGVTNAMDNELDMNSNKITNLAAPENANDAARKADVDAISVAANQITGNVGSTDNALVRASGTTGLNLQGSPTTLSDDGTITTANVVTTDIQAATATLSGLLTVGTINTGQGATEVYLQNQNLRTTDDATFADVTVDNLITSGNVDGRDVSVDGSKLDTIETGAEVNPDALEIKTLYESNADTNAFTDSLLSKLNGIEAGAEVNTVDSVNSRTGAVVLDADDISDAATTNKFTTASDISKLAGIEAGADVTDTANVTAAGALMDSELTNEAAVKAINQGLATTDTVTHNGITSTNGITVSSGTSALQALTATTGSFSGSVTVNNNSINIRDTIGTGPINVLPPINWVGLDSTSSLFTAAQIVPVISDDTSGSEDGRLDLKVVEAGTSTTKIQINSSSVEIKDDLEVEGNAGFGITAGSERVRIQSQADTNAGFLVRSNAGVNTFFTGQGNGTYTGSPNGSNSAFKSIQDSTTGRSGNFSGTLNASGADYAEYVVKSKSCKPVMKGDVIGFDSNGNITDSFNNAVQFGVKSTNPNLVGGDTWAKTPRPEMMEPDVIEYTGIEKPKPILDEEGNDTQDYSQYHADQADYDQAIADEQARVDALNESNYNEWFEQHEQERATVDRIAFCGVVPVNTDIECVAGDYLIAFSGDSDAIALVAKSKSDMTFGEFSDCIGRVKSIGEDGRPLIIVKVG